MVHYSEEKTMLRNVTDDCLINMANLCTETHGHGQLCSVHPATQISQGRVSSSLTSHLPGQGNIGHSASADSPQMHWLAVSRPAHFPF